VDYTPGLFDNENSGPAPTPGLFDDHSNDVAPTPDLFADESQQQEKPGGIVAFLRRAANATNNALIDTANTGLELYGKAREAVVGPYEKLTEPLHVEQPAPQIQHIQPQEDSLSPTARTIADIGGGFIGQAPAFIAGGEVAAPLEGVPMAGKLLKPMGQFVAGGALASEHGRTTEGAVENAAMGTVGPIVGRVAEAVPMGNIAQRVAAGAGFASVQAADDAAHGRDANPVETGIAGLMGAAFHEPTPAARVAIGAALRDRIGRQAVEPQAEPEMVADEGLQAAAQTENAGMNPDVQTGSAAPETPVNEPVDPMTRLLLKRPERQLPAPAEVEPVAPTPGLFDSEITQEGGESGGSGERQTEGQETAQLNQPESGVISSEEKGRQKEGLLNEPVATGVGGGGGETPPAEPAIETPAHDMLDPGKFPVQRTRVADIKSDPATFQYKLRTDKRGVNKPLKGEWDELAAGNMLLWEDRSGNRYVVNGHHRLAHAQDLGVDTINAQVLREADGYTPTDARRIAAESNIKDGKGTVHDTAEFIRLSPEYHETAVAEKRGVSGQGHTIGSATTDNTYDAFRNGKISAAQAEAIGEAAPRNEALQNAALDEIDKSPRMSGEDVKAHLYAMQAARESGRHKVKSTSADMFGLDDSGIKEARDVRKVATSWRSELKKIIDSSEGAITDPERAKQMGVASKNQKLSEQELARAKEHYESLGRQYTPELYQELLAESEKRASEGYGKKNKLVKQDRAEEAVKTLKANLKSSALKTGNKSRGSFNADPESLKALLDLGLYHFEAGAREFADWSKKMVDHVGESVRPHLQAVWNHIQQTHAKPVAIPDEPALQELTKKLKGVGGGVKPQMEVAYDFGKKIAAAKNAVSKGVSGLRMVGQALKQRIVAPPEWDSFHGALGRRQLALSESTLNADKFLKESNAEFPLRVDREAMTNYIDMGGDAEKLKAAAAKARPEYKLGYKKALQLTPEQEKAAADVKSYFEKRLDDAQQAGILEEGLEDYIHRLYEKDSRWKQDAISELRGGVFTGKPSLAKQRVFKYDADAEAAGYSPVKDVRKRVAAYDMSLNKAIADRAFVKELMGWKMPDGKPAIDAAGIGVPVEGSTEGTETLLVKPQFKADSDYTSYDYPAVRKWKWLHTDENGNSVVMQGNVLVHKDALSKINAVFGRSALRKSIVARTMLNLSSEIKQTMLSLSAFHQGQIGVHATEHRVNPLRPVELDLANPTQRELVSHGLVVADHRANELFTEGVSSGGGMLRHVPIIGQRLHQYNEWLFQNYIPRIKMTMALHALERNKQRFPNMSEDQLHALTASQANAAFGGLNYEMLGRNKTMQDFWRMTLLAPDFLEARGRFVAQAATKGGKEQLAALMLGAGAMYLTARMVNKAINDDPQWSWEHAFEVKYNGRWYGLRTVQGDILHAVSSPLHFMYNRVNPVWVKAPIEALTGLDRFGRKADLKKQVQDFAETVIPISLRGFVNPSEEDLSESLINSLGVTERREKNEPPFGMKEAGDLGLKPSKAHLRKGETRDKLKQRTAEEGKAVESAWREYMQSAEYNSLSKEERADALKQIRREEQRAVREDYAIAP
jgi:hypothetical protein